MTGATNSSTKSHSFLGSKFSAPETKSFSMWDKKYDEATGEGKTILDRGAQTWFKKRFSDLDEEDQQKVVDNEHYHHGDFVTQVKARAYDQKYYDYLDGLRESGQTNMFGAGEYLVREFSIDKNLARAILADWMKNFGTEGKSINKNPTDAELKSMVAKYLAKKKSELKSIENDSEVQRIIDRVDSEGLGALDDVPALAKRKGWSENKLMSYIHSQIDPQHYRERDYKSTEQKSRKSFVYHQHMIRIEKDDKTGFQEIYADDELIDSGENLGDAEFVARQWVDDNYDKDGDEIKSAEQKSLRHRESKVFNVELKDGMVIGTTGVLIDTQPDLYNDICTKDCLKDMVEQITERKITMDLEHETFRGEHNISLNKAIIPISKITEASYQDDGMGHGFIQIKDSLNTHNSRYKEVAGSIQDKYLTAYSIAYRPEMVSYKRVGGTDFRILDKVSLLNVTYTGVPVNPRAEIGGVQMKSFSNDDNEILVKIANGEGVNAKSVDSLAEIEAKSKVEKKDFDDDRDEQLDVVAKQMYGKDFMELSDSQKARVISVAKEEGYTEGKSKGVKTMTKTEKKAEEAPVADAGTSVPSTTPATPDANSPGGEGNSLEDVLKEILARLSMVESKQSDLSNSMNPTPAEKADPTMLSEPSGPDIEERYGHETDTKADAACKSCGTKAMLNADGNCPACAGSAETKSMKLTILDLKAKLEEQDKLLSQPQVKARLSNMEAEIKSQEAKATTSLLSKV